MRTLTLAILLLTVFAARAQQGAVTFANSAGTTLRLEGTNVNARVALYGSTSTGLSSDTSLTQIGNVTNTFVPGVFIGGTRFIGNPGNVVTLQVRAWTGGFATYEQAYFAAMTDPGVFCACSQRWEQPVGGGALPTQPITGSSRFGGLILGGFVTPCPVPEPSSIALAFLGALFFGFYARRKN